MRLARALEQKRAHPVLLPAQPPPLAATRCLGCPIALGCPITLFGVIAVQKLLRLVF